MWETIRGYLTFTRKERYGVLSLLLLISVLFVLPYFFRPLPGDPDPASYERMKQAIQQFQMEHPDSPVDAVTYNRYTGKKPTLIKSGNPALAFNGQMFYFDPNSLKVTDWLKLGLPERLAQTIMRYVGKGGRFRNPEDLKKIYGLPPPDYERLLPYVRIARPADYVQNRSGYYAKSIYDILAVKKTDSFFNTRPAQINAGHEISHSGKKMEITDINLADSAAWARLPGIGAKLASRIVHFRERLGGFYQVDQVSETFGLPDSTFQKVKPVLRLNQVSLVQLDLNNATKESLQAHPLIRWQIAKEIIEYRMQHGNFRSVDELLQLAQMDPVKFEKLKPYLAVRP
jgi:competence protein ComEA